MNEEFVLELKKLLDCFPGSYINHDLKVILIPKTNTYFSLVGCSTKRDIVKKVAHIANDHEVKIKTVVKEGAYEIY